MLIGDFMAFAYLIGAIIAAAIIGYGAWFSYSNRKNFCCEMTSMMLGMTYGTIASLVAGTLVGLYAGDFVWAMIIGTIVGIAVGVPLGALGGPLGRMEGVMAGPMGGMMGAMLGVMARPYDIELFMVFFYALLLLIVFEITNVVYKKLGKQLDINQMINASVLSAVILAIVYFLNFSVDIASATGPFGSIEKSIQVQDSSNNAQLQVPEEQLTTRLENGVQTIELRATAFGYTPNRIVAKAGTPIRITALADNNAGCSRSLTFKDFGIRKILNPGVPQTIEFTPTQAGKYVYSCGMAMFRGELVVV